MKKIILFLLAVTVSKTIFTQGVGVNESGAAADGSAILDVSSTTKGLLVPRMTQTQRNAISSPATGLSVYQTDFNDGYYYYDGSKWLNMGYNHLDYTDNLSIGWTTIAVLEGRTGGSASGTGSSAQRAIGDFIIIDETSSRHQSIKFTATHLFGGNNYIYLNASSDYSSEVIQQIRIKENSTYDGAVLQVYISNSTNDLNIKLSNNYHNLGWVLIDGVADAIDPSTGSLGLGYTNAYSTFSQSAIVDLNTDDLLRGGVSFPANLNVEGHMKLGGSNKELRFYEGTNYVGFEAPALSADQIWVLPTADGTSGQVLQTDGSGTLSWTTPSSGTMVYPLDIYSFYSNDASAVKSLAGVNTTQASGDKWFYFNISIPSYNVDKARPFVITGFNINRESGETWWNKYIYSVDEFGNHTQLELNTDFYQGSVVWTLSSPVVMQQNLRYVLRIVTSCNSGCSDEKITGIEVLGNWQ